MYIGNSPATGDNNSFKLLDDISSYTLTFNGSSGSIVSTTNDTITQNNHRFLTGQRVTYTAAGTVIGGLTSGNVYFIIKTDYSTFKLATSYSNAVNSVAIDLTALGTGTHTINVAFDGFNTRFKTTYDNGTRTQISRAAQLQISINGVIQQPNDTANPVNGFGIDLDSVVVFSAAPAASDVFWGNVLANNFPTFDLSDNTIDSFTGNGSQVSFALSKTPANSQNVLVTINGVVQYPTDGSTVRSYSVDGNVLIFTDPPTAASVIQVRHIGFAGPTSSNVTGFYGRTGNVGLTTADAINVGSATIGVGAAGTSLLVQGNARITGILTIGTGSITFDGNANTITGISTISAPSISGVATFSTGPVLIGAGTSTGTAAQRLQVTGGGYVSGNLGVGSTNPQYRLDISGGDLNLPEGNSIRFGGNGRIQVSTGGAQSLSLIQLIAHPTIQPTITELNTGSSGNTLRVAAGVNVRGGMIDFVGGGSTDNPAGCLVFRSGAVFSQGLSPERMRLFSTGEVGIGTTVLSGTSSQLLQVAGGGYFSGRIGIGTTNTNIVGVNDNCSVLSLYSNGANIFARSVLELTNPVVQSNNAVLGDIHFTSARTSVTGFTTEWSLIRSILTGSPSSFGYGTAITFHTKSNNGAASFRETARFDSEANFLIGATTPTGTASQPLQVTGGAYVSGNIGIGSTIPQQVLDVNGNIRMNAVPGTNTNADLPVLFQTSAGTIDGGSSLTFNPGGDSLSVNGAVISSQQFRGSGSFVSLTTTNGGGTAQYEATDTTLTLKTGGAERIKVNANGNIGFFGSNPNNIVGVGLSAYVSIDIGNATSEPRTGIRVTRNYTVHPGRSDNLYAIQGCFLGSGQSGTLKKDMGGVYGFTGVELTGGIVGVATAGVYTQGIAVLADATQPNTDGYGYTNAFWGDIRRISGGATNGGLRGMYLKFDNHQTQEGIVWDTDYSGANTITIGRWVRNGIQVGSITCTTSATTYGTSSDYRLKENVVPLTGAIDRLKQILVHRFNFISEPNKTVDGFIAHEVEPFIPEAITGVKDEMRKVPVIDNNGQSVFNEDGKQVLKDEPVYQNIDQSKLVPLLTAALQEALEKIENLQARLDAAGL